jgi:hypothetical protein
MLSAAIAPTEIYAQATTLRPHDSVNDGSLPVIIQAAMRQDLELSPPEQRNAIVAKVARLKTRSDAAAYLAEVSAKRNTAMSPSQ